ncbi:MAG: glycosyltransferase family 4 protein [Chloroflexi bacterium]|nr:glycosyltransferase family 4 protein [Chloroflexota bacterium]
MTIMADIRREGMSFGPNRPGLHFLPLKVGGPSSSARFALNYLSRATWEARRLRGTFQVLHGHSGFLDYAIVTAITARILGARAVHTVYCPLPSRATAPVNLARVVLQRAIAKQIDLLVAVSENVARSLREIGIPDRKIRVLPPPINISRFLASIDRQEGRRRFRLPSKGPVVLFVGSTKKIKNLETVLSAMSLVVRAIPECSLVITTELEGPNHHSRAALLSQRIQELGLSNHVIRLGIIPDIPDLMAASDLLVAPFLSTHGISDYFMAAIEAMAVGRPIVVSNVGGMPEVVNHEVGILVDPENTSDVAQSILSLLQNPVRLSEMGCAAQSRAKSIFDPELIGVRVESIYREVTGQ